MGSLTASILSAGTLVLALAASGCDGGGSTSQPQSSEYGDTGAGEEAPATREAETRQPVTAGCDAQAAQFAVGQEATPDLIDRAKRAAGAADLRVIAPGTAVTMDFRDDRLNLETDAANVVTRVKCG